MNRRVAPASVIATVLLAAIAAGCAGKPPISSEPSVNISDGFFLELWIIGEERYATLYRVNGAHELGFGGGPDAFNHRISWVGSVDDEQYARLQELLDQHGWFAGTVSSTGEPPERISRIRLRWPGGSRRFKIKGDSPDIEPVRRLLDEAARQRLHGELERLPEAGEELYK